MGSSMIKLVTIESNNTEAYSYSSSFNYAFRKNTWVRLVPSIRNSTTISDNILPEGQGVVISSGGSTKGPCPCFQPSSHLNLSAQATGKWLQAQGINQKECLILNPLPMHHISGLMPWWRSRNWGCRYNTVNPALMKDPIALEESFKSLFTRKHDPILISLVPTQLFRLLKHPAGIRWLKSLSIIWIGGSALSKNVASTAREHRLPLAPCYGSTETAAMITALTPREFLDGKETCGQPLSDVELRLEGKNSLFIKTPRLAIGHVVDGKFESISNINGWWESGDCANLIQEMNSVSLQILGRRDTAIHSGGETIFPENLENTLRDAAKTYDIPIKNIMLVPIESIEWGHRVIALISWRESVENTKNYTSTFQNIVKEWHPAQQPIEWIECPKLSTTAAGKLERTKWIKWLKDKKSL